MHNIKTIIIFLTNIDLISSKNMDTTDKVSAPSKISVAQFYSVALAIVEHCQGIIKDVHSSGQMGRKDKSEGKGDDDPVTIADLKVQKTIELTLKHFFP